VTTQLAPDPTADCVLAGVLYSRAGTIIHEIVHMPDQQLIRFDRICLLSP